MTTPTPPSGTGSATAAPATGSDGADARIAQLEAEIERHAATNRDLWKQLGLLRDIEAGLTAENASLRETIGEWQEIHGTFTGDVHRACQVEIERLRAALQEARDAIAGEIPMQRGGNGPWIPSNPDDPFLALVKRIDAALGDPW